MAAVTERATTAAAGGGIASIGSSSIDAAAAAAAHDAAAAAASSGLLAGALDVAHHWAGQVAFGAAVLAASAVLVEAVPLIALSRKMTARQALRFAAHPADAAGRLRHAGGAALSLLPYTAWAAWLLAALVARDRGARLLYLGYAGAYAAPLAHFSDGFAHATPAAAAVWLCCAAHVQVHRVLQTNRVV